MLEVGTKAPDFKLKNQFDEFIKLSDFLGTKVIVYFYPKDNTPGCTREACSFKESHQNYVDKGYIVLGISKDTVTSHQNFVKKYDLPFMLLSDPDLEAIKAYDVWQEKKLYGKLTMGVVRSTYIVDEKGTIEKVFPKANPDTNAKEILDYLG